MKNNSKRNLIKINYLSEQEVDLSDDLPSEIDFSVLKQINNPVKKTVSIKLDGDLAIHFRSSKELNQFIRLQLKSLAIIR